MWLLDQWAERHIRDAQNKGDFDDLPEAANLLCWKMIRTLRLNCGPDTVY